MAKRFTDTDKWENEWFMNLSDKYKLAFLFLLDKCDAAGVWKPNEKLIQFFLGDITLKEIIKHLGNRLHVLSNGKWWLHKFIDYQYTKLREESTSKPIRSHIALLKKHGLWKLYSKGIYTLKEKEKNKDKDKEKDVKVGKFIKPRSNEITEYAKSIDYNLDGDIFCDFYESKGWVVGKSKMKDWQSCVRNWKRNNFDKSKKPLTFADNIKGDIDYDKGRDTLFKKEAI